MIQRPLAAAGAVLIAAGSVFFTGSAASADSFPSAECVIDCVVTVDTAGTGTVEIPEGVTSLTVTVAGGAGSAPAQATHVFPGATGGAGGVSTVELGAAYAGTTFVYAVGGSGEGSAIGVEASILVVAGGGGDAGYAGRLDLSDPDQIFSSYPGGVGGAPTAPGFAAGGDGTAAAANGGGASGAVGVGGAGTLAVGNAGGYTDMVAGTITLGAGGLGGTATLAVSHEGGSGGSGAYGGGGAGITQTEIDENPLSIVGAGGGGSGFLADGLTGSASTNEGTGYVSFEWSYSPTISTVSSVVHGGDTVSAAISGLPASRAFTVVFGGVTVASGVADASGAATVSFAVAATQGAGSFPLVLTVAGVPIASSAAVEVAAPALAATGAETNGVLVVGGALLLAGAVLLGTARLRRRALAR